MTSLNKQALREAADKATKGQWAVEFDDEIYSTDGVNHEQIAMVFSENEASDAAFIAAANPATVLALLDELEAAEKQLTSWRSLAKKNIEEHEKAVVALDAARQRICELESKLTLSESWSLAAQKYIAELEARTVTLPEALNSYGGMKIYRPKDVIEAIRAAGIGVKGE